MPRRPGSDDPQYRTIADGAGVAITGTNAQDRVFLAQDKVAYKDEVVSFEGRMGFARVGGAAPLRLMVAGGRVASGGATLSSAGSAALVYDGKSVTVQYAGEKPSVALAGALKGATVRMVEAR